MARAPYQAPECLVVEIAPGAALLGTISGYESEDLGYD